MQKAKRDEKARPAAKSWSWSGFATQWSAEQFAVTRSAMASHWYRLHAALALTSEKLLLAGPFCGAACSGPALVSRALSHLHWETQRRANTQLLPDCTARYYTHALLFGAARRTDCEACACCRVSSPGRCPLSSEERSGHWKPRRAGPGAN